MKTAKEMFEDLGYFYKYNKDYKIIQYTYEDWSISFDIENKMVGCCNMGSYCELTVSDIQAINKQVEELE